MREITTLLLILDLAAISPSDLAGEIAARSRVRVQAVISLDSTCERVIEFAGISGPPGFVPNLE